MVLGLFLVSCGGGDSALVGKWYLVEGPSRNNPEDMELFKDKTAIVDKTGGVTWKTEKGVFYLSHPLMAASWSYKVSGSTLILTDDDGDNLVYMIPGGSSALVGKWIPIEGKIKTDSYIFADDGFNFTKAGKGDVDGDDIIWATKKDQLVLVVVDWDSYSFGYKVSGSTLTLTSDDGQSVKLKKQ